MTTLDQQEIQHDADNLFEMIDDACGYAEGMWGNQTLTEYQDRTMRLTVRALKSAMNLVESLPRIGQMNTQGILDLHDVVDEALHRVSELVNYEKGLTRDQRLLLKAAHGNLRSAFDHIKGAANVE